MKGGWNMKKVYLSSPHMGGKEKEYIDEAFETNWIAPLGPNVDAFEKEVSEFNGVKAAVALNSGTAAIHLGLKAIGVGQGDIVLCSSLTFAGSCNPILYEKAIPVFIDSEPMSWNMSPIALEKALKIHRPKAVIVVHLYGQSADMETITEICNRYNVPIIEDAAESFGATYKGQKSGSIGKIGIYSFNGNKIITTSGGGMLVSDDEKIVNKVRFWATQAKEPARHYEHNEIGYNYRMSNICAGIGRGQLRILDERISRKKEIYMLYKDSFSDIQEIQMMPICTYGEGNYWLSVMTVSPISKITPLDIMIELEKHNVESRPIWKPMHLQPVYQSFDFYSHYESDRRSVGEEVFKSGVCLPSDTKMTFQEMDEIISIIRGLF